MRSPAQRRRRGRADDALAHEKRRLSRAFTAALVALSPAAVVAACTETETRLAASATAEIDAGIDAPDEAADAGMEPSCGVMVTTTDAGHDGDPGCIYQLPCGLASDVTVVGCEIFVGPDGSIPLNCTVVEGEGCTGGVYTPGPSGAVTIDCGDCLGGAGRRPRGLARAPRACARTTLGAYFARMAYEEAAAVHAFRCLRDELAAYRAPHALLCAAERSLRDEERHARVMARRARAHGAPAPAPRARRAPPRSLEAMALENAVEGCVRETFGALLLRFQAARAPDPALRRAFARIALDEERHAALSWAVARWAEARLDRAACARVASARRRAAAALCRARPPFAFDPLVGRPSAADGERLAAALFTALDLA